MRVISRKRLEEFYVRHGAAKAPLTAWYRVISASQFGDFNELRTTFRSVDYVKGLYVFDAGPFRLITAIHFNRQIVFVRHVLTHDEYDRGTWKGK
jgi:mRNA interferase HigB